MCRECRNDDEARKREIRKDRLRGLKCAHDGCDRIRYEMASQVFAYCHEHALEFQRKRETAKRRAAGAKPASKRPPDHNGKRWCSGCTTMLPLDYFYVAKKSADGSCLRRSSHCKACSLSMNSMNKRERKFGVSRDLLSALLEAQGGECGVCSRILSGRYAVDHDHEIERMTGQISIRGLLCRNCNSGIGLVGDNLMSTLRASIYLARGSAAVNDQDMMRRLLNVLEVDNLHTQGVLNNA